VGEILADGRVPLVLGGECSVTIAVMCAFRDTDMEPALLYMDGGVDLFTLATNPTGILDSMALAHLLDEPGCASELAGSGADSAAAGGGPPAAVRLHPRRGCPAGRGRPSRPGGDAG
jgi:arginase family enzyme